MASNANWGWESMGSRNGEVRAGSLFSVFYVPGGAVEPADSTSRFF